MNVSGLVMSMLSRMVCLALIVGVGFAQNSPDDFLSAHNVVRSELGLNPLLWDTTVADFAQNYAFQRSGDCQNIHSGGGYGENLFNGYGQEYTAADAVNSWVKERANYDSSSNTCAPGQQCGHYTQVVWRDSERLGCARVKCDNGYTFINCNYYPPGNIDGQRPY